MSGENMAVKKTGWMEGTSDGGRGGLAPGGACENQWPLGKPAELNYQENTVAKGSRKDTASICHTLTAGKRERRREREGWVAD